MFPDLTQDDVFRIETQRLWLRWPQLSDAQAIADFAGHPDVAKMTASWNAGVSVEEVARRIGQTRDLNEAGKILRLIMTFKETPDQAIGQLGLDALPGARLGLGYHMHPRQWNKGLMSEAVCALATQGFLLTKARLIQAHVRICNPASSKVLLKCGFHSAGMEISDTLVHGRIEKELFQLNRGTASLLSVA